MLIISLNLSSFIFCCFYTRLLTRSASTWCRLTLNESGETTLAGRGQLAAAISFHCHFTHRAHADAMRTRHCNRWGPLEWILPLSPGQVPSSMMLRLAPFPPPFSLKAVSLQRVGVSYPLCFEWANLVSSLDKTFLKGRGHVLCYPLVPQGCVMSSR